MLNFNEIKDKPLWQMTGEEFVSLQQYSQSVNRPDPMPETKTGPEVPRYVYGIKGISTVFNCSHVKAQAIKNSGIIDAAITQSGRKIVVDAELALKLVRDFNNKRRVR